VRGFHDNAAAAAAAAALCLCSVAPFVFLASVNPDADQYAWSAGYYGKKLLAGDFEQRGSDPFLDPGWDPGSYWGRSMGTRAVYALALATPWAHAPKLPYSYVEPTLQGPQTRLDRRSRLVLRTVALTCAVLGAGLLALRFGWPAVAAMAVVLILPGNAEGFARAWAEAPLLLAFGLVAVSYGSRWFPVVLGVASTAKLTAVGLWPLALVRSAHGWRSRVLALLATVATWVLLTPPSWYRGGPGLLVTLADARVAEYGAGQSSSGGLFLPARYFWPFELALALLLATWAWRRRQPTRPVGGRRGIATLDVTDGRL